MFGCFIGGARSIRALTDSSGTLVNGSLARYESYGGFRTVPTTNPGITDRGFTGHKHNNTGSNDLDLIYSTKITARKSLLEQRV
jgi:hypothetical protein